MRIGLYGMPAAGKTYILDKIDFLTVFHGSKMLFEICPDFNLKNDTEKESVRKELADYLSTQNDFIMDGHYAFGDEVVFTENDGCLYDVILYLYISPSELKRRIECSEKNRKYLNYDIEAWQKNEIESLREYCHDKEKDFYVLDNPPENVFEDISNIIQFIKAITEGYSCNTFARKCAEDILSSSETASIVLMDGDKTLTVEDSSNTVFGYKTNIYDGNFYTGFQAWKQREEFKNYTFDDLKEMPVSLNEKVIKSVSKDTYILTSGHERVWNFISGKLGIPFFCGCEMSAETKMYIVKNLQRAGKKVIAYGDGMNDYYMLKQSNEGFLIKKKDGNISRSLKERDLEGINIV